jgi:hypothetical protein
MPGTSSAIDKCRIVAFLRGTIVVLCLAFSLGEAGAREIERSVYQLFAKVCDSEVVEARWGGGWPHEC